MNFQSPELGQIQESWTLKEHVQICCIPQQKVLRNMTASKCISVQAVSVGGWGWETLLPRRKRKAQLPVGQLPAPSGQGQESCGPLDPEGHAHIWPQQPQVRACLHPPHGQQVNPDRVKQDKSCFAFQLDEGCRDNMSDREAK